MHTPRFMRQFIGLAIGALIAGGAAAQAYPARPIKLIVPFPAGSQTDLVARVLSVPLQEELKQPIVIDNKPGANGAIGAQAVARSAADGYTLMMTTAGIQATNVALFTKLPYDAVKDFTAVSRVGTTGMMLMVRADYPAKTIDQLVQHLKANPGKATAGFGSPLAQVAVSLLESKANVKVESVRYKGIPPAVTDLLGGSIDFTFVDVANAVPQLKSGKLVGLGVTPPDRFATAPDVPALGEKLPGYAIASWFGVMAPAGTPPDIVARLDRALADILARPDVKEKMLSVGSVPAHMPSATLKELIPNEIANWVKLAKLADIKPE
ncbi:MAG TPA: tripartite tricarboxylate transporter substrate binding protein [Ramlibacter sp.]|nr:tripartite tricarboxylate transporter substrate binding protein [Ramlibacter sp.]